MLRFASLLALGIVGCAANVDDVGEAAGNLTTAAPAAEAKALTAGLAHTCALTTGGGVRCWGSNVAGELGTGNFESSPVPVLSSGLQTGVKAIATSNHGSHSCALLDTPAGTVKCWGRNDTGQVGNGSVGGRVTMPTEVAGLGPGVASIAMTLDRTYAVMADGTVRYWGLDDTISSAPNPVPRPVRFLTDVRSLVAGRRTTCVLTSAGKVQCWGSNLPNGSLDSSRTPVDAIELGPNVKALAAGTNHVCALTAAGGVKCWGSNANFEAGIDDATPVQVSTPGAVLDPDAVPLANVTAIAAGASHTCALHKNGDVSCWGSNEGGAIDGRGGPPFRRAFVVQSGAKAITRGGAHGCMLARDGAHCWGSSDSGQLGTGALHLLVDAQSNVTGVVSLSHTPN